MDPKEVLGWKKAWPTAQHGTCGHDVCVKLGLVGDPLPDDTLAYFDEQDQLQQVSVHSLAAGKKVILFGVPGDFTPTCSLKHVPGFIEKADELKSKGVDEILCISVNDPFVMKAWAKTFPKNKSVKFLADGSAKYTHALGLELDLSEKGLGTRSRRFALLVDDLKVKAANVESGGDFTVSSADDILKMNINQWISNIVMYDARRLLKGYPSSTSRAIQTLGGSEAILKARSSKSNKLELRFRPEDPYSHPAFGEVRPCNNLLLKISKKKTSQPCDGQSPKLSNQTFKHPLHDAADVGNVPEIHQLESDSVVARKEAEKQKSEDQVNLFADIVARVSEAYHFDGMADYQHVVAVHADVARRKKRNWTEVEDPQFGEAFIVLFSLLLEK
ncbi:peroxiredoxin-2B [Citrus sinensis]|uniref:Peroxiredoxin-2B n=1 Tax=Citrus sinensis TaxID=2711 RepID=A0ACB8NTX6_CITSI|nr:peroxiredoxin-2B [Citrus sinensis]